MLSMIKSLHVTQLTIMDSAVVFADVAFPMTGLKTLEVVVPTKLEQTNKLRAALQQLPHLEALHLLEGAETTWQAARIKDVCAELSALSNFTSLTIAAARSPVRLPAASLKHLKSLQLSCKASVEAPPSGLRRLYFQELSLDTGFDALALQVEDLASFAYLQAELFSHQALCQLPTTLHISL